MSSRTEPLAAVLAEMRASSISTVRAWADRIEVAVERERNAHTNDIHNALYMATGIPGNAAAIREALENVERVARFCAEAPRHTPAYPTDAARADVLYSRIAELGRVARAALATPARNCDRFATADEAEREYCREAFFNGYEDPVIRAAFRWAFATPAKEGGQP